MTPSDSIETDQLLARLEQGDAAALEELVALHRDYLKRLIDLRIDDFLRRRPTSFKIWLRRKALEKLIDVRREHLAEKRSVRRDIRLSGASSMAIASQLLSGGPSQAMQRKELMQQVRSAIEQLSELDREILLLRHVEELSNIETAELLGVTADTARKRHGRAIRRLSEQIGDTGISFG